MEEAEAEGEMSGVESKAGKREGGGEMEAFGKLQAEGKICFAATIIGRNSLSSISFVAGFIMIRGPSKRDKSQYVTSFLYFK